MVEESEPGCTAGVAFVLSVLVLIVIAMWASVRIDLREERMESQRLRNELQRERELNIDMKIPGRIHDSIKN